MVSRPKLPPQQEPTRVPLPPTQADASVVTSGQRELQRYASILGSAGQGTSLARKAKTQKASLIGGG